MKKWILSVLLMVSACAQSAPIQTQEPVIEELSPVSTQPAVVPAATDMILSADPVFDEQVALPPGPVTLVTLGDSLTQGDGDDSGRGGYPGRLLERLESVRPGSNLTNLGQSGWSSDALINGDQGLESQLDRAVAVLEDAASQGHAALALVWIGSNDLWYLYEYGGNVNDDGDAQDAERYRTNMELIVKRLRETGAVVVLALLDDQSKRPVAIKGEAFVETTPEELSRMSAQVTRYNAILQAVAESNGALTVDFYATDIFTNAATLYDDGNHPNQAGYDIIAQNWWDVILSML